MPERLKLLCRTTDFSEKNNTNKSDKEIDETDLFYKKISLPENGNKINNFVKLKYKYENKKKPTKAEREVAKKSRGILVSNAPLGYPKQVLTPNPSRGLKNHLPTLSNFGLNSSFT